MGIKLEPNIWQKQTEQNPNSKDHAFTFFSSNLHVHENDDRSWDVRLGRRLALFVSVAMLPSTAPSGTAISIHYWQTECTRWRSQWNCCFLQSLMHGDAVLDDKEWPCLSVQPEGLFCFAFVIDGRLTLYPTSLYWPEIRGDWPRILTRTLKCRKYNENLALQMCAKMIRNCSHITAILISI